MLNKIGREIPESVPGFGKLKPYNGVHAEYPSVNKYGIPMKKRVPGDKKVLKSIEEAIEKTELKDGMTVSFHHHLRNGDFVLPMVLEKIFAKGIRNINIISSSLTNAHQIITEYIKKGWINLVHTSGVRGDFGKLYSEGIPEKPFIVRSHGGRARAVITGQVHIDVAFLGVSEADFIGNANGVNGPSAFGSAGYAFTDLHYADKVVLITDNLKDRPIKDVSFSKTFVDYIVPVEKIGDPAKIQSGATRLTRDPVALKIAWQTAQLIQHSPYFKEGFSFQTGTGASSLAVAHYLRDIMLKRKIRGSFGLGGITGYMCKMLEDDLFDVLYNVQSFDTDAVENMRHESRHIEISADDYANPFGDPIVNYLDIVILSALEIDTKFNVNVISGSDGVMRGASGGHCDTAAGSKLTIVVAPSIRARIPTIKDDVITVVTPGETVDVLVTERGIAINPLRKDLVDAFKGTDLNIKTIEELKNDIEKLTGVPKPIEFTDKVTGLIEYRDGTIIDVVRQIKRFAEN